MSPPAVLGESSPRASALTRRLLAAFAASLVVLQLALSWRSSLDELRVSLLCAAALAVLVWSKRTSLKLGADVSSSIIGAVLIAYALVRVWNAPGNLFASLVPLLWGTGLALLASGVSGAGQYWREALVLGAMAGAPSLETLALDLGGTDLAPLTASASAFTLRLGGWHASARDVLVQIPTGWVLVSQGCSGLKTMYFLVGFAVIVLLIYPVPGFLRKVIVIVGAAAIGFLVNSLRITMLALLSTPEHHRAFVFWHIKQGTMAIELISVVAFLCFFSALIPTRRSRPQTAPR